MSARPARDEAAEYYFKYIDRIHEEDICAVLEAQASDAMALFASIPEGQSLHRYAADKWTIRETLCHVNDCERLAVGRAFWFARGFDTEMPSFDQNIAIAAAHANHRSWASHLEEFRAVRAATFTFFRNLPGDAWMKRGIASGNPFTVRALAFVAAGHVDHHNAILRERYLGSAA
jgi:DinB family protein